MEIAYFIPKLQAKVETTYKIGENLCLKVTGWELLAIKPKAQKKKDKLDFIKIAV